MVQGSSQRRASGLPWRERCVGGGGRSSCSATASRRWRGCRVHTLRGGPEVLERREQVLAGWRRMLDEGRVGEGRAQTPPPPLTAEGLVGAASDSPRAPDAPQAPPLVISQAS